MGYAGAGTVEFLYHPGEKFFAFLEVNTRLQVEHPITEVTTDTDLVKLQIHVAGGGRLEGERPDGGRARRRGAAQRRGPRPRLRPVTRAGSRCSTCPSGPGIRVDTGVGEGDSIPADFDSMIAKIIAYGRDRDEALARLRRAMGETTVVIEGGATNKSFILDLLDQPEVIDGSADTGWIDRVRAEGRLVSHRHSGIALVAAGIEGYEDEEAVERTRLLETARGGRPQVQHRTGRAIDLKLRGTAYKVTVRRIGPHRFRVAIAAGATEQTVDADLDRLDEYTSRITIAGRTHRLITATHGPMHLVEVDGVTHRVSRDEGGVLRSPAPALVVATPVAVGAEVAAGAPVLVLESMKMETVLPAPFAGRVKELLVSAGSQVETGTPLVRLEPIGDGDEAAAGVDDEPIDLDLPDGTGRRRRRCTADHARDALAAMLLGYDLDQRDEGSTLASYLAARDELTAEGSSQIRAEVDVLEVFADFAELSRNRPAGEEAHVEHRVHSPREHFHTYLQSLDPDRGALPEQFRSKLAQRACATTASTASTAPPSSSRRCSGSSCPAALRTRRRAGHLAAQRWMVEPCPEPPLDAAAREVLDRLVVATQLRFPVVGDLARSVRFRWFDQPLVDADRASVLGGVSDELDRPGG